MKGKGKEGGGGGGGGGKGMVYISSLSKSMPVFQSLDVQASFDTTQRIQGG